MNSRLPTLLLLLPAFAAACAASPRPAADASVDAARDAADAADVVDAADAADVVDVVDVVERRDVPVERCAVGFDTDGDGVDNDVECREGTDPDRADTDADGLSDGIERAYPRACVADDRARQRRPVAACAAMTDCMAGERCAGLSATTPDTDGDGVRDGLEDPDGDGTITGTRGETDPRVWDTDGDGRNDAASSFAICRPDMLIEPGRVTVPRGAFGLALDPAWGMARREVMGTTDATSGAVLLDDPALSLAAMVFERASTGTDVRVEATAAEEELVAALTAVPVLVGHTVTTHESLPAVRSVYRVATTQQAGALRDRLAARWLGAAVPAGTPAYAPAAEHLVEVVTVLRTDRPRRAVLVTVLPTTVADDPRVLSAIRADDLVNTTSIADRTSLLDFQCQRFEAAGQSLVDFLWLVDTSGSMSDDQERLGNTATRFFARLTAAGVDFRVGVFESGSVDLNLDDPGFAFINGADPGGARLLSWQVTTARYMNNVRDIYRPYRFAGAQEEPVAAGVYAYEALQARKAMGTLDPDRRLREGATTVAFFVTDEPGTNDNAAFGRNAARWGTSYSMRLRSVVDFYREQGIPTFGLVNDYRSACTAENVNDMPKCVILNNGGSFIPITTATDGEVSAAMDRIVERVAGVASQYQLDRTPISSTILVRIDGRVVPRSRLDGFDYDAAARSVVFYGPTYRPRRGAEVVVSYRVWAGSIG